MVDLSKSMEQYLETIYELEKEGKTASVSDIAEAHGVKLPSVTYVLRKLSHSDLDLVNYERYTREVSLTKKGKEIAVRLEKTHEALRWFFEMIGLNPKIANTDACELEHLVHPQTVDKLTSFVEWVKNDETATDWLARFRARKN
ncbi:MAG: metal-dependent transcriptional regulator [Candidatus Thorarchaeota archaeon]|nr:metal-dependent transcriptional regulator [Candidatus Thorarchaeota archaeon]